MTNLNRVGTPFTLTYLGVRDAKEAKSFEISHSSWRTYLADLAVFRPWYVISARVMYLHIQIRHYE